MPYPVLPPQPPSLVHLLRSEEVPPSGVQNLSEENQTLSAEDPTVERGTISPEPERLLSSPLPELQRRSRAELLLPVEVKIGWSKASIEFPQAGTSSQDNLNFISDLSSSPPSLLGKGVGGLGSSSSPPSLSGKGVGGLGSSAPLPDRSVTVRMYERSVSGDATPILKFTYRLDLPPKVGQDEAESIARSIEQTPTEPVLLSFPASNAIALSRKSQSGIGKSKNIAQLPALKKSPLPQTVPTLQPVQMPTLVPEDVVEITSDRQEYDVERKIVTAQGNVLVRVRNSVLDADRVQINLVSRMAVADGNIAWTRGEQVLRGQRFEYNFVQEVGYLAPSSGELYLPSSGADFSPTLPTDVSAVAVQEQPLSDRITANQPLENVTSPPGGYSVVVGTGFKQTGELKRVRYETDRIELTPEGGIAENIRFTNDPFSPPELELRAERAKLTRLSPYQDEIRATRPRLVFDGGFSLPFLRNRIIIDRRDRDPALFRFGYDRKERGGLFVEAPLEPISNRVVRLKVTPQFFIQRALEEGFSNIGALFGLRAKLNANLGPRTTAQGSISFENLDLSTLEDRVRASLRLNQGINTPIGLHTLTGEYSYRDRLYNGSLGYQTVQRSVGAVLTSPVIPLGKTRINLSYQLGAQWINADSDRIDLLDPIRENERIDLSRFLVSAALSRGIRLWRGEALPATPTEGLKYTPVPVVPYLQLILGLRGVNANYSSGDNQSTLTGTVGLIGQFGHFSRRWLDYTGFNITYTQVLQDGSSPFLFDRVADARVLGAGITQQIYGPFRIGFQTALNLDSSESINTDYFIEYSRRTYGITLRYNPVREIGSLTLRISDFNWTGSGEPFSGSDVRTIDGGVRRDYD